MASQFENALDGVVVGADGRFHSADADSESTMPYIHNQAPRPPRPPQAPPQAPQRRSWLTLPTPKTGAIALLALSMAAVVLI